MRLLRLFFASLVFGRTVFGVPLELVYTGQVTDTQGNVVSNLDADAPASSIGGLRISFWDTPWNGGPAPQTPPGARRTVDLLAGAYVSGSSCANYSPGCLSVRDTYVTACSGSAPFTSCQPVTTSSNGVFTLSLYLSLPDFDAIFQDSASSTYIQIERVYVNVGTGAVTSVSFYPRQRFASAPYCLKVPIDSSLTYTAGRLGVGSGAIGSSQLAGNIADTKLAQISTAGKVGGSAITGTIGNGTSIDTSGNINTTGTLTVNGVAVTTGAGVSGYLTQWTGASTTDTSPLFNSGGNIGIGTTSTPAKLSFPAATTAAGGLSFGGDANLYRSTGGRLQTDSELYVRSSGGWYVRAALAAASANANATIANENALPAFTVHNDAQTDNNATAFMEFTGGSSVNATIMGRLGVAKFYDGAQGHGELVWATGNQSGYTVNAFTEHLRVSAAGQLRLPAQGVNGGIVLGVDTSLYRSAVNTLRSGGTVVVDGNVGIGAPSPTAKLHVGGTAGVDGIRFPDGTLQTTAATGGGLPPGMVSAFAGSSCPSGWLLADGSAVSRFAYEPLFLYLGTMYGVGDGSTTFNLPDYRGEFLRGRDGGRGADPDRASRTNRGDGTGGDAVGTRQSDAFQGHGHQLSGNTSSGGSVSRNTVFNNGANTVTPAYSNIDVMAPVSHASYGSARASTESRGRNVSVLYCVKS